MADWQIDDDPEAERYLIHPPEVVADFKWQVRAVARGSGERFVGLLVEDNKPGKPRRWLILSPDVARELAADLEREADTFDEAAPSG